MLIETFKVYQVVIISPAPLLCMYKKINLKNVVQDSLSKFANTVQLTDVQ